MKKSTFANIVMGILLVAVTGVFLLEVRENRVVHPFIQSSYSWPSKLVSKCIRSTSVFFVEYPDGGIVGSGVLVSKEGLVLTAAHLFTHGKQYKKVVMVMYNGNSYDMDVLLVDPRIDLALVEPVASAQSFEFAKIQKSDALSVGQDVLVVGHPYEDYWTVTDGVISRLIWSIWYFGDIIETNALVNPGNSGGPMFNVNGEVIGIISAMKMTRLGQKTGIGVAISVKEIHSFLRLYESRKRHSQIKRYRIGDVK